MALLLCRPGHDVRRRPSSMRAGSAGWPVRRATTVLRRVASPPRAARPSPGSRAAAMRCSASASCRSSCSLSARARSAASALAAATARAISACASADAARLRSAISAAAASACSLATRALSRSARIRCSRDSITPPTCGSAQWASAAVERAEDQEHPDDLRDRQRIGEVELGHAPGSRLGGPDASRPSCGLRALSGEVSAVRRPESAPDKARPAPRRFQSAWKRSR